MHNGKHPTRRMNERVDQESKSHNIRESAVCQASMMTTVIAARLGGTRGTCGLSVFETAAASHWLGDDSYL